MDTRPLPPHPSLEQYKKQAKDLLKACASADPDAVRAWAQQWFRACADEWVDTEARLRAIPVTAPVRESFERELVERIVKNILASRLAKPDAKLADAQFFVARGHGFDSWAKFAKQVQALQQRDSLEARFEGAADAVIAGDLDTLQRLLRENPQLIRARSKRVHNSTLLHYVAANGVEDFRQKTPKNAVEVAKLLLDAGADVNAESNAYGGGCTTLGLVATSVHPERAGVQEGLMQLLLEHGASDQAGAAGNRHTLVEGCLWNGRGNAARFLAARGARLTLETAAGVGNLSEVKRYFNDEGVLTPEAAKDQLQRGFLWACQYGYDEVVDFLLARGADLRDQAKTGETGLHWAVVGAHVSTIRLLLAHGAPLEELNAYGGTALGQAGWSFVNGDPGIDWIPIFDTLLAAGAKIEGSWLAWLDQQHGPPAAAKARLAELLRRYGAAT